tara:strand:- start:211 stop:555 length:345 start_codon:yes stop_codon:yes gene_type:complete
MEVLVYFINAIEGSFLKIFGFNIFGLIGFLIGLAFLYLFIYLIHREKISEEIPLDESVIKDLGDPTETKINLARSYIEMGQIQKSKQLLEDILENESHTESQRERIRNLLSQSN